MPYVGVKSGRPRVPLGGRSAASLGALVARSPDHRWDDVTHLLSFGEGEEAMDVLIETLVHDAVPEMLDQLNVDTDGPSI